MNTIQLNPDVPLNIREQLNGLPSDETFRRKLEDQKILVFNQCFARFFILFLLTYKYYSLTHVMHR